METKPSEGTHKAADAAFTPMFGGAELVLSETPKAVTPFGGLSGFVALLRQIGLGARVMRAMPFPAPTSPNAIPLAHTFTAFLFAVVTGASRFAHADWLRGDRAWHAMPGFRRFPGDDTVRRFFRRYTQRQTEAFWRPLWAWLPRLVVVPPDGVHPDLDSTIFSREEKPEGARTGCNPQRKGRPSHPPLVSGVGRGAVRPAWLVAQRRWQLGPWSGGVSDGGFGARPGGVEARLRASRQRVLRG